jgi:hypothetical protein
MMRTSSTHTRIEAGSEDEAVEGVAVTCYDSNRQTHQSVSDAFNWLKGPKFRGFVLIPTKIEARSQERHCLLSHPGMGTGSCGAAVTWGKTLI